MFEDWVSQNFSEDDCEPKPNYPAKNYLVNRVHFFDNSCDADAHTIKNSSTNYAKFLTGVQSIGNFWPDRHNFAIFVDSIHLLTSSFVSGNYKIQRDVYS